MKVNTIRDLRVKRTDGTAYNLDIGCPVELPDADAQSLMRKYPSWIRQVDDNTLAQPPVEVDPSIPLPTTLPKLLTFKVGQYITWNSPRFGVRSGRVIAVDGGWLVTNSDRGVLEWTHAVHVAAYRIGL